MNDHVIIENITRGMLMDIRSWPHVGYLCMKKPRERPDGTFPKVGIITARQYSPHCIMVINHPDALLGKFVEKFGSIDELLTAGWIVD